MDDQDRVVSTGERPDVLSKENQRDSSKDERAAPAKRAPPALVTGTSSHVAAEQPKPSDGGGELSDGQLLDFYGPDGPSPGSGAYDWSAYQRYLTSDGMHLVSPVMYSDNASLMYHSGYGYNPELAYGQYSPVAAPLGSFYVDGPMYSPQQVPFSPSYYPQPSPPSLAPMSSAFPATPTEQRTSESSSTDNMAFGSGSGYFVDYRSFSGADLSGNVSSPLPSPGIYPQPMGILGSYEQSFGQRSMHGYGMAASPFTGRYPQNTSHQTSTFGGPYYPFGNDRGRLTVDKGRRGERDWDSVSVYSNSNDNSNDRNRGPRASKLKDKTTSDQESSSIARKTDLSAFGINIDTINRKDFITDYEEAKFFIIKSFSEDNVHKSIKYSVWASTPHGNKKLDAAYHEAKSSKNSCPVFLLFSVNASGQFCGVAEMVGPVDFEKDADYWQQDRWNGQFPVQWRIIKDVPNNHFRHILLENNDNKPVTHSRDCQEVNLNQGIELLKIFNDYDARTSIIDDFDFYDDRESCLKERKARQQVSATKDASDTPAVDTVKKISDISNQTLEMKGSSGKESSEHEHESGSVTDSVVHEQDDVQKISDSFSQVLQLEENEKELAPSSEKVVAPDSELVDEKVNVV